jgi:hypothetical protein
MPSFKLAFIWVIIFFCLQHQCTFVGIVHVGVYTPSNETELGTIGVRVYYDYVGMEA